MCGSVFLQEGEDEENPEEGCEGHGAGPSHVEAELLAGGSQWKHPADHCEDALGTQCQGHSHGGRGEGDPGPQVTDARYGLRSFRESVWGETRRAQGHPGIIQGSAVHSRGWRETQQCGERRDLGRFKVMRGVRTWKGKTEQQLRRELDTGTSDHREGE